MCSIIYLCLLFALCDSFGVTVFERLVDAKGRTLYLVKEDRTWSDADSFCESYLGGRLVSVRDETEAHNIALLVNDLHHDYHWGGQLTYYVGGRWNAQERVWVNLDGTHTPHPTQVCDGAAMTIGAMWKKGQIMATCNPSQRAMFFICSDSKA